MNRRSFLNSAAIGVATLAFFTKVAKAQTVPPVTPTPTVPPASPAIPVSINLDISNNHATTAPSLTRALLSVTN